MGIAEADTLPGEIVNVRYQSLGMTCRMHGPVIEIITEDEYHVGPVIGFVWLA